MLPLRLIRLPKMRKKNAALRRAKILQKYLMTREPNGICELDAQDLEILRKALSKYIAEELIKTTTEVEQR